MHNMFLALLSLNGSVSAGSNYSVHHENVWLRPNMSLENPIMPPVVRGFNCSVHHAQNYSHFKELLAQQWTE